MITWPIPVSEAYCVDSGRPVRYEAGDRCISHGNRGEMCTTALRDPRCEHPRLSPNHPYPHCSECGLSGQADPHTPDTRTPGRDDKERR